MWVIVGTASEEQMASADIQDGAKEPNYPKAP